MAVLYGDGKIKKAELNCPYLVEIAVLGNSFKNAVAEVTCFDLRLSPEGFTYSFNLSVTLQDLNCKTESIVKNVEILGEKQVNNSAISVFIPKNGETLWDACKILGACEEEILKFNPSLGQVFTGEERIILFREEK